MCLINMHKAGQASLFRFLFTLLFVRFSPKVVTYLAHLMDIWLFMGRKHPPDKLPINCILMTEPEKLVIGFIEDIWNNSRFAKLCQYLHPEFIDHSLPFGAQNGRGFHAYLKVLSEDVSHHTEIESIITEQDFAIIGIKMTLSTLQDLSVHRENEVLQGQRILAFRDQKIIGHWEFFGILPNDTNPHQQI